MGGICSRRSTEDGALAAAIPHVNGHFTYGSGIVYQSHGLEIRENNVAEDMEVREKPLREPFSFPELGPISHGSNIDDINDGIPRLSRALSHKSRSTKSKQVAIAKVDEQACREYGGHIAWNLSTGIILKLDSLHFFQALQKIISVQS